MDGMLSQDEINALLNGMASGEIVPEPTPEPTPEPAPAEEPAPVQTENRAVLVQDFVVFFPGDAAATGGDQKPGFLANAFQRLGFPISENGFAILRKDPGDAFLCHFLNECVRIHKSSPGHFRQHSTHRGFTASRHADEDDILHGHSSR